MTLLLGAVTLGLIMSLLAIGVYVSFRIFRTADITVDGSITLGAAVTAVLLAAGHAPAAAMALGFAAGLAAGCITGILQTRFGIDALLAGILVMTGLYSVNLHVMGKSNVPLLSAATLGTACERWGRRLFGGAETAIAGWPVNTRDLMLLAVIAAIVAAAAAVLYRFFRSEIGTAMRAAGSTPQKAAALGADVMRCRIFGLALANGLVALSGGLLAQYQGFADAQMGIGTIVYALASVIIGEALTGAGTLGFALIGTIMGSVAFRLFIAIALRWGLNPNALKLITAVFVFAALMLPAVLKRRGADAQAH